MTTRLRVPVDRVDAVEIDLEGDVARYVTRVHRLTVGDGFTAFDPARAVEADATIVAVGRATCRIRITPWRTASVRAERRVTLIQAIGRGDKFDAILRDATELGVTHVVPVVAERSLARPSGERSPRWQKIAVEAARQCGRGDAPSIDAVSPLADVLAKMAERPAALNDVALCLDPRADRGIGAVLRGLDASSEVTVLVGPEGGLSPDEIASAERARFQRVTMGKLVLRTETVCAAVLGALLVLGETERSRSDGP